MAIKTILFYPQNLNPAANSSTSGPLSPPFSYPKLGIRGKLRMPAVVVFGLSAIACRNFFLYYWRAMSLAQA
jgi:hypothetical protein